MICHLLDNEEWFLIRLRADHADGGAPLLSWQRRRALRRDVADGRSGSVTVIQRFGGALNLKIHFHTLVLDGVFTVAADDGAVQFHASPPPTDGEVAQLLTAIRTRILRLLTRRGLGAVSQQPLGQLDEFERRCRI